MMDEQALLEGILAELKSLNQSLYCILKMCQGATLTIPDKDEK